MRKLVSKTRVGIIIATTWLGLALRLTIGKVGILAVILRVGLVLRKVRRVTTEWLLLLLLTSILAGGLRLLLLLLLSHAWINRLRKGRRRSGINTAADCG